MLLSTNDPVEPVIATTVLLCKFIEKIYAINVQTEMAKLSSWTECPLQKLTQALLTELGQLENGLPSHVYNNSKISPYVSETLVPLLTNCQTKYKSCDNSPESKSML
jgi:hypothetical protein